MSTLGLWPAWLRLAFNLPQQAGRRHPHSPLNNTQGTDLPPRKGGSAVPTPDLQELRCAHGPCCSTSLRQRVRGASRSAVPLQSTVPLAAAEYPPCLCSVGFQPRRELCPPLLSISPLPLIPQPLKPSLWPCYFSKELRTCPVCAPSCTPSTLAAPTLI